jgi:apolipoprotein N-acyltransferase
LDLSATAFLYGISVEKLTERLRQRQAQTARAAYATFGFGALSLGLWLYGALHVALSSARIVSALELLPFCTLFFLLAFKSAWLNWQLRTRQLGSAGDFLRTTEPFLPR